MEAVLAVKIVLVRRLPRDSLSLGEAKKVFIFISFCIVDRPFIEEASDIASLKSSRRALSDRASFFARKLATPPSKTPFFGGRLHGNTHLENTGFRIHVLRNLIGQFESADV
jgi:hypothetical protein